jgi:hypothetical protein
MAYSARTSELKLRNTSVLFLSLELMLLFFRTNSLDQTRYQVNIVTQLHQPRVPSEWSGTYTCSAPLWDPLTSSYRPI